MHLDKLIELFEKNVSMYSNPVEIAALEHLRELRSIKEKGTRPNREPKAQIAPLKEYALELGVSSGSILMSMRHYESSPKPVGGTTVRNRQLLHYDRDEFYNWWNNREKKSADDSV